MPSPASLSVSSFFISPNLCSGGWEAAELNTLWKVFHTIVKFKSSGTAAISETCDSPMLIIATSLIVLSDTNFDLCQKSLNLDGA
ncbi:hypothetical protein CEXT_604941 [Caerostris extrusa]|uniref:Uncharacterized protein n=1 Tax=Caerostris extrusa TaxID=172846 RepID=A0AAV4S019_CAEEX|nr:hypothetical protein CEXT_604941 [Caerostris extrusa]